MCPYLPTFPISSAGIVLLFFGFFLGLFWIVFEEILNRNNNNNNKKKRSGPTPLIILLHGIMLETQALSLLSSEEVKFI